MPGPSFIDFPSETPFEEFESMVRDGMAITWDSPTLQKNGRPGQEQNGVDVYGLDHLGRPVAIQCKRYKRKLKLKVIETEIKNAEGFEPGGKLNCLYLATSAPRDAVLQKEVRVLSEARVKQDKFAVGLLYWDDILSGLIKDPQVFKSYFAYAAPPGSISAANADTKPTALTLGYYGRFLWHYIEIAYSEAGWLANQDLEEIRTILRLIRAGAAIAEPSVGAELVAWTSELEAKLFAAGGISQNDWHGIRRTAKRVEDRVKYLPSLHPNVDEGLFIDFGIELGAIFWNDGEFTESKASKIAIKFKKLIPGSMLALQETLARLQGKSCHTAAPSLMTLADHELKWPSK